ncbi:cation transporter, putative [Entamoeba invadens IP1]|uniref:Cation transporter, putative n=1 Tax=Entamoeba invadens IP1 TaxID=370355 RepID=A0A0A1U322_ENTIV|nr:cation transporter, putative [Entamoeba invadens IP1]ELP88452.1 cation transporter, putative [Entamoeba invadens IP1]|eukprot:XP_004255223.1 cation transporter, putative [Entamoeba invadens IP1]
MQNGILKRVLSSLQSFYSYHTYYTLFMSFLVAVVTYYFERDYSQITILQAMFLGITTATDTGLLTFDFSVTTLQTQVVVCFASEICGVMFASTIVPSLCRYYRLYNIAHQLQKEKKYQQSNGGVMDFSSSEDIEDDKTITIQDETFVVITSEMEPLVFDYELELKSLKYFIYVQLFYTTFFKLVGFICILIATYTDDTIVAYLKGQQVNGLWFSLFTTISAFNNLGLTINQDSLMPFNHNYPIILACVFLNATGNIMIPIMTRWIVFCLHRIFEKKSKTEPMGMSNQPLLYILKAPTRMSLYFFSSTQTKLLFVVQLFLMFLQTSFFCLLYSKNDIQPFLIGFAHSSFTRTAGFAAVNPKELWPPVLFTYMLSMYVANYPVVILRKIRDDEVNLSSGLAQLQTNVGTIFNYVKDMFFNHTVWVYVFSLLVMWSYTTNHQHDAEPAQVTLDVLFEVSSAIGTVGMSLGSNKLPCSFSADLTPVGQCFICILMILGRHRGFPTQSYPLDYYKYWKNRKVFS